MMVRISLYSCGYITDGFYTNIRASKKSKMTIKEKSHLTSVRFFLLFIIFWYTRDIHRKSNIMKTLLSKIPGLLHPSQWPNQASKKPSKVTTTVRMDRDFKNHVDSFAKSQNMDFTTFFTFALTNTMKHGGKIEPYYEVSDAYAKHLDEIEARYDRGEDKAYWPFSTKKENRTFLESIS